MKKYRAYIGIGTVTLLLCGVIMLWDWWAGRQQQEWQTLKRNETGQGDSEVSLILEAEDMLEEYPYSVSVWERQITEEEAEDVFAEAIQELETVILGENPSLEAVSTELTPPTQLMQGAVTVSCYFDPYNLVDLDGRILWDNLTEDKALVKVTAEMSCQEWEAVHEFYIQLTPEPLQGQAALLKEIKERIQQENEAAGQEYLELPAEVNGVSLHWYQQTESRWMQVLALGLVAGVSYYVYGKEKKEQQRKAWQKGLILDYPNLVSQLSLLTGAGMTVLSAWGKIAGEYRQQQERGALGNQGEDRKSRKHGKFRKHGRLGKHSKSAKYAIRPGYEEMLKTWYELQDGIGEIQAYENFGLRCELPQYRKFAGILTQNVRKGTKGMQQLLDLEAKEAFCQRKAYAKQLGQEAGTKLLAPMGIMLLLVFAILLLPALVSLNL